jgi:serine/threonine-protein kinase
MEGLFAVLLPAAIVFIVFHYRYRTRELELRAKQAADPKLLEKAAEEKKQLEARIQNLEAIVCSVDFELNQRLNRLTAHSVAAPVAKGDTPRLALAVGAPKPSPSLVTGPTLGPTSPLPASPAPLVSYALGVLAPGQVVLGRYTIVREIGRGGMGAVYLAEDAKLAERVALKTISTACCADEYEHLADRFRREVQAARRVTHENVIRIHDLGEDRQLLFLSMEYVEGETLWTRVRRQGGLPIAEARPILEAMAAGVAAAHAAGVVHRDLKPHNVLLAPRQVKVIDFGLAKATFMAGMTATGSIIGTPDYMAPEQIRGGDADARSDVYALGATAYAVLAGQPPFEGSTPIAVGFKAVNEPPRPLRELRPEVPPALESAILRALAKDPVARFRDAAEWRRALTA